MIMTTTTKKKITVGTAENRAVVIRARASRAVTVGYCHTSLSGRLITRTKTNTSIKVMVVVMALMIMVITTRRKMKNDNDMRRLN